MRPASKFSVIGTAALFLLTIVPTTTAKYSGGTGEPNDPYQIATAGDLMLLGESPYDYDKHFILIADIDMDPNLPGRKRFSKAVIAPDTIYNELGFQGISFKGVFDGNGHAITHLNIPIGNYLGLFGKLDSEAQIMNLGLVNVSIAGSSSVVGGIVGYNAGSITDCYSTGKVNGTGFSVGGLVGNNREGVITNCYSTGTVSGNENVGGLVGLNSGDVTNCYSTSGVSGDHYVGGLVGRNNAGSIAGSYSIGSVSGDDSVGGLVGYNYGDSTVIQCYSAGAVNGTSFAGGLVGYSSPTKIMHSIWDMEMSGLSESAGGVGLTTAEMMDAYMLGLNGFADDPNWVLDVGRDYARLAWEGTAGQIIPEPSIERLNGLGTAEEPYMIDVADQLIVLGRARASVLWDKHFILGADIDLDPNLLGGQIFSQAVIPTFTGVYDGNGHSISHLTIKGDGNLGLFGLLGPGAEVKNLGAVDVNITGSGGGLVGENEGTVTQCYSTGMVTGNEDDIGGLVGYNNGTLTQSYSTCMVSGLGNLGGLVGRNCGSVSQSYSTGVVSGDGRVGGLVGFNIYAGITCCYSTGAVRGNRDVGGLVGYSYYGGVNACYWDIETSGQVTSAGGWGRTTAEMQTATTFLTIRTDRMGRVYPGWDFVDGTANGTEDIWWILEGVDYPRLVWELNEDEQAEAAGNLPAGQ